MRVSHRVALVVFGMSWGVAGRDGNGRQQEGQKNYHCRREQPTFHRGSTNIRRLRNVPVPADTRYLAVKVLDPPVIDCCKNGRLTA